MKRKVSSGLNDVVESIDLILFYVIVNRNCVWPSRETNSRYMRPIATPTNPFTFDPSPFSPLNTSTRPSTFSPLVQQQERLWSRFRSAASALRNDAWPEPVLPTLSNPLAFTPASMSSTPLLAQPVLSHPSVSLQDSPPSLRQRKVIHPMESNAIQAPAPKQPASAYSFSKFFFTFTIFIIGLVLGYVLTSTFPPNQLWQTCLNGLQWVNHLLQTLIKYCQSFRSN